MHPIEIHILKLLSTNESKAFELIYEHYYADLCVYALRFFNSTEEAKDIVQQTIIKIWEQKEKLQKTEYLKTYIFKCVHNACLNKIREIKVQYVSESEEFLQNLKFEFTDELISKEQCLEIEEAIAQLPAQCRTVLELNRYQGMSYKEIAEKLNISHRTVDSHLTHATRFLKNRLKDMILASSICLFLFDKL